MPKHIHPKAPPHQPPPQNHPGWAYGIFVLNRFAEWDPGTRELGIHYLISTKFPLPSAPDALAAAQ
jgi:hypothetical protein